ncbi:amidohydrolase family protein [Yeosuana sp. MJ-SS3]|uniref:Amidohydrolase family protein n=1 Tax=Gilvirhabdus luticola TaxID=3079858 RepID=A0ABU3UA71_9FLAO|nr:amidohydrolase family protein [Yeosuana sp. MJ-SS3]MDU8886980.1 amidohydrolase family protein [Yeosuana sp. MJ-SS3]
MIIDSHQHFWIYDPVRDGWIDESKKVIRKDFLPSDFELILKSNNVDGCIAVQADQSEKETNFLLELADENSIIKGVVGWVNLLDSNVEDKLAYYSKCKFFKGVRHIVQAESEDFMLRDDFQKGICKLAQFGLTFDILVFPDQLKNAIELVRKFPNQKFILDHLGKPFIKDKKIKNWESDIRNLAQFPNVACKVSGMVTEANWEDWKTSDFDKYLDVIFESFGVKRVMYGSDWPVCLLAASYKQQLNILQNYLNSFTERDKNKVMGANAIQIYKL